MKTNNNLLLMTDVYKLGHMRMYKPGTTKEYTLEEIRNRSME